jgi:hypothetical protein
VPKSLGTFLVDCCSCCLGEEVWRAGVWCMSKRTQVRWSSEKHQRGSASLLGLSERAKWRGLILIIIGGKVLVGHEASSFEVIRFCMRCVRGEDPEEDQVACVFCSAAGSCSKLSCLHCDKPIPCLQNCSALAKRHISMGDLHCCCVCPTSILPFGCINTYKMHSACTLWGCVGLVKLMRWTG